MFTREEIIAKLKTCLDQERFEHSLNTEKIALKLAKRYKVSLKKTSLAALLHDFAKQYSRQQLLALAKQLKLTIDPIRELDPNLFHPQISAILAANIFKVKDKQILSGIAKHTTGSPNMTKLEKVIYLADHIEVARNYFGVNKIRQAAFKDMDQAVSICSTLMLKYLIDNKLPIFEDTIKTQNYYLLRTKA